MSGPSPVVIEFVTKGLPEVLKALKSIQDVVTKTERQSVAATKAGSSEKQRASDKAAREQVANVVRAEKMAQAAMLAGLRNRANQFKAESVAHSKELNVRLTNQSRHLLAQYKAEQAATNARHGELTKKAKQLSKDVQKTQEEKYRALEKQADKWAAQDSKTRDQASSKAQKAANAEARLAQQLGIERKKAQLELKRGVPTDKAEHSPQARMALIDSARGKSSEEQKAILDKAKYARQEAQIDRQKRRLAEAEEKKASKVLEDEERRRQGIRERSANTAGQLAKRQAAEEAKARAAAAKEQGQRNERFNTAVLGGVGGAGKGAMTIAGRAAQSIMNVGGGFSLEDSLQREMAFKDEANKIAVKTQTGISQAKIESSARALAVSQGIDKSDVLKAYNEVTKLNDEALPMAMQVMPDIAKIADVTGTDMQDMGALTANILATNPKIGKKELKQQLRTFATQGIEGGVEIADFAKYGSRITAGSVYFGNEDIEMHAAKLGMGAQISRQFGGANNAAEATLAAQRFAEDLSKKKKHLAGMGVNVADDKGNLREMDDVLIEMLEKNDKITDLPEFKMGERGNKVLLGAAKLYQQAGGGEAGRKVIRDKFRNATKNISEEEVDKKFQQRLNSTQKQLAINMEKLRNEVGLRLLPKLHELMPIIAKAIPHFVKLLDGVIKLAEWAQRNPFQAVGAALAVAIGKEVAAAGLQAVLQKSLSTSLGSGALSVASAVLTIAMAKMIVEEMARAEDQKQVNTANADLAALNNRNLLKPGGIQSQEDLDKARSVAAGLQGSIEEKQGEVGGSKLQFGSAFVGAMIRDALTGGMAGATKEVVEDRKAAVGRDSKELEQQKAQLEAFTKAIQEAEKAMKALAAGTPSGGGGGAGNGPANQGAPSRAQPIPKRSGK
jgi:hypothetical protein